MDYCGRPLSSTTIQRYIHKCHFKLLYAKKKLYVNLVQRWRQLLWARRPIFVGRNGRRVLRTRNQKKHPDCYEQPVQKPGSVMCWLVSVPLTKLLSTSVMAALIQKSSLRFYSNICCLQEHIFSRELHAFFNKTM